MKKYLFLVFTISTIVSFSQNKTIVPKSGTIVFIKVDVVLDNNLEGLTVATYSNLFNIKTKILTSFHNGLLVYLNNLQSVPPFYPTFYSVLTPTNQ